MDRGIVKQGGRTTKHIIYCSGDITVFQVLCGLIGRIISILKSQKFTQSKPYSAVLRFAHAESIAPFAAILNLEGASTATKNIQTFDQLWKAKNIIPFSANIQMLLYKNPWNNSYLVKFLLNEKETKIKGLGTKIAPYYLYKDVRAFYLKKLKDLGLGLNSNMEEYLNNAK